MDNSFSKEFKELVSKSREMAIDLGYDYVSTVHFLLADCESKSKSSILNFGFKDETTYLKFKKSYTLEKVDYLNLINEIIPLTKEAESTIRLTETERKLQKHKKCFPFHFFIAAFKNKESLVFECFEKDGDALNKLLQYYQDLGEFTKNDTLDKTNSNKGLLFRFGNLFSRNK